VINVTWDDAQKYVAWFSKMTGRSYRLLTEAEWEYAARAGSTTAYFWGDEIGKNNANCSGCGSQWDSREPSPVDSFKPNAFGLHDMAGNVWQWVQDCYHGDYDGAPIDGSAWAIEDCNDRVARGGSWLLDPLRVRSANRSRNPRRHPEPQYRFPAGEDAYALNRYLFISWFQSEALIVFCGRVR